MTIAYIGLGSNSGNRRELMRKAVDELGAVDRLSVSVVSSIIETKALGSADQPDYLNAVAKVETSLPAERLLEQMMSVEDSLGRVREGVWSARTIDLDLLLYGDEVIDGARLTVPHRQMHLRSFVLSGMCELDGDFAHPVLKRSMRELKERLSGRDFVLSPDAAQLISIAGVIGVGKTTLGDGLAGALGCELLREAYDENPFLADEYAGRAEAALDCEMFFLNSRIEQLGRQVLPAGETVVADYVFDKQMIYAKQWLSPPELESFCRRNQEAKEVVAQPVLVIYLKGAQEMCLQRIRKRNRPYEQQIKLSMLKNISDGYEKLFGEWDVCPVIRIDAGRLDCRDSKSVEGLTGEVGSYIWKSSGK